MINGICRRRRSKKKDERGRGQLDVEKVQKARSDDRCVSVIPLPLKRTNWPVTSVSCRR